MDIALSCTDKDGLVFAIVSKERGVATNATPEQIEALLCSEDLTVQGIGVMLKEIISLRGQLKSYSSTLRPSIGLDIAQRIMDEMFIKDDRILK